MCPPELIGLCDLNIKKKTSNKINETLFHLLLKLHFKNHSIEKW